MKQKKCKNCKGTGYVPVNFMGAGRARGIEVCPVCKGTGKIETEPKEKRIEELEEKISVLLSCKNCPENKDGLICQKEYENKCLAQKIQFIKELQQENAELKGQVEMSYEVYNNNLDYSHHIEEQLTKAKEVIEELYNIIPASMSDYAKEPMEHARKFMTEE